MGVPRPTAHVVYCESRILLDRQRYDSWRDIQDTYSDYKASLGPWSEEEVIEFFTVDFGDESRWPFTQMAINEFFRTGATVLEGPISRG